MRRRAGWASLVLLIGGCAQVEPSGGLFEPAPGSSTQASSATGDPSASTVASEVPADGGFDFEADGRDADRASEPDATSQEPALDRLAAGLGVASEQSAETANPATAPEGADTATPPPPAAPSLPAPPAVPPVVAQPAQAAAPMAWKPGNALDGSFGVRLVSTVNDGTPPRAILGLPDGSEVVVKPGTMLAEHQLVVLAIGRNAIQIAEVTPSGDHAKVNTQVLSSLYPSAAPER